MSRSILWAFLLALAGIEFSGSATTINAVLALQPRVPMAQLAQDVTNPQSARYHKFYTPEEIRNISAPSQGEYDQLLLKLNNLGFNVERESATHLWIFIVGDSSAFEKAFSTQLQFSGAHHMALSPAKIPADLGLVQAVIGLDNTRHAVPRYTGLRSAAAPGPNSGIPQATIKSAYGLSQVYSQGITGKNQNIAIATYMGFTITDVQSFYQLSGLNPVPTVDQVVFNGTPAYDQTSAMETELDGEFSGMIAPGAAIHVFASATNDDSGEVGVFTAILDDNRSQVANYSWGECETAEDAGHMQQMDPIFQRAVAQGVNIMVATGDNGSDTCENGTTVPDFPAADPNVVAVGGTSFRMNGTTLAETAWVDGGGGISGAWGLPTWQQQLGSPYTMRSYPDVAFNADPMTGQSIYVTQGQGATPGWMIVGGTSMAAPQWCGFMALVGEARANAGKATLGYLDPIIYGFDAQIRSQGFNDITSGKNGAYGAGPGWDAVTGWGSPQAAGLLGVLEAN